MTEAVLFDFDGTLVDSDAAIVWCVNELLRRHGFDMVEPNKIIPLIGIGLTPLLGHFFNEPELFVTEYRTLYREGFADRTTLYPGALDVLAGLRTEGIKTAIVTNRNAELASDIIKAMGFLSCLDGLVGENGHIALKPAPDLIYEACKILGVDPRASVMVGDTSIDIETGKAAGCRTVFFTRGLSVMAPDADYTISSLSELPGLL